MEQFTYLNKNSFLISDHLRSLLGSGYYHEDG